MDASIPHLDRLMAGLADFTNLPLDTQGLISMSEEVGLNDKYIYEYIVRKKEKARTAGQSTISVQSSKLDKIAKHLGHNNYLAFVTSIEKPIAPVLLSLVGNYYSYVRRNDDQGFILRSPVRIYLSDGKIIFKLKGPMRVYHGEVKFKHGCLFVLMEEEAGKEIHHVYKIGTRLKPEVLQGIFSGVSTNFDPIGGRTALVRTESEFDTLQRKEADLKEYSQSTLPVEKTIATYLAEYAKNNLKINRVVKFGEPDLDSE